MKVPAQLFLIIAAACWGGNLVFGRALADSLPPFGLSLIRWLLAAVVLIPLTAVREDGIKIPPRATWLSLALMSFAGVTLFSGLSYAALQRITSTNASLINATSPVMTIVLAALLGMDRLTIRRVLGTAISLAGVAWIVSRGSIDVLLNLSFNIGDLLMLAGALLWGMYTVFARIVTRYISPLAATTITVILALPVLLVWGGYQLLTQPIGPFTPTVWLGILYVGIAPSVIAMVFWNKGIEMIGAARASIFLNLTPVFAIVFAVFTLGERPGTAQLVGGVLVIGGVLMASMGGRTPVAESKVPVEAT